MIEIYKTIYQENFPALRRILIWAAIWSAVGFLSYIIYPELLPKLQTFLEEVFKEILGEDKLAISFETVFVIFQNNLTAALLAIVFGIILGLLPLFAIAVNFFVLGFLFSVFLFSGDVHYFLIGIIPHGVFELPAILIAAAMGLRLGFFWWKPLEGRTAGRNLVIILKQILQILPVLVFLFFLAAVIEVFVTGNLAESLVK